MLVTFKTSAYSDITLFGSAATTLLKMMGQSGNVPGAILAADLPAAIELLKQELKVQQDEKSAQAPDRAADALSDSDDDEPPPVPLAQRATPLLQLMEAAAAAGENVMWNAD